MDQQTSITPARRWTLCVLMLAATTLIYLDRQAVGLLAPFIQSELHIDNAGLGLIFSAFYYAYTLAQFAVGPLLDRYSLRWLYGCSILAWAATSTLTGFAPGFAALLAVRVLLGIMESGNWPGAMRIVSRALPPEQRALGNGIFTSGTSVGALIAPALILGVAATTGWRLSFAVLGVLGVIWFAVWLAATSHPSLRSVWKSDTSSRVPTGLAMYSSVLRNSQFWRVFCVTISVNPVLYFFLNWLPTYYRQQHGITAGSQLTGILTATFLALDLGYLSCGAAVLLLTRMGLTLTSARRSVFVLASILLSGCALIPYTKDLYNIVAILIAADFAIGIWIAMYLTLAQEVHPTAVSTAAGLLGGSGSFAGAILMWLVGKATQLSGSFAIPFFIVAGLACVAAAAGWTASRRTPTSASAVSTLEERQH
ncbi:MAG: MFS transporter [Bryobacteraceae bacterium]|nr:MFS transporter [Bryobacteraceae bacterium]